MLSSPGPERERALADLRVLLVRGLRYALGSWRRSVGLEFEALIEDFAQEALLRILDNLNTFAGRSRFTTWAQKIAVRTALTELRRRRWRDVSLDGILEQGGMKSLPASADGSPEAAAENADTLTWVRRLMHEELSDKQRAAITAVAFEGIALEEVARRLGTNRNALYKTIHDGRLRLKRRLAREGLSPGELLAGLEGV